MAKIVILTSGDRVILKADVRLWNLQTHEGVSQMNSAISEALSVALTLEGEDRLEKDEP